ncbi:MAG TPA: metallophosphoesterase, partial [Chitinophagaceae bacterium]|nr:metallophosphoesterase [Chitinophagaceae bacterium]
MQQFTLKNQRLVLHPSRVLYWEEAAALIISDLHFGKTGHFRKAGIAIPQNVYKEDLQRLVSLLQYFQPGQLIITGDLFHSKANKELELFKKWRQDLSALPIHLVKGNHDILQDQWYEEAGITV